MFVLLCVYVYAWMCVTCVYRVYERINIYAYVCVQFMGMHVLLSISTCMRMRVCNYGLHVCFCTWACMYASLCA